MIYLHLRVSTDRQESEGQGLAGQELAGRSLFPSQDIVIRTEVGSGRKEALKDRLVMMETLDLLKAGDTLWFHDESRLARHVETKSQIMRQVMKKGAFLQIGSEQFNLDDPQTLLRLNIVGSFDQFMGAWLVKKMKEGRDVAVISKGRWYGGITAFGYKKIEGDRKDPNYHNLTTEPEEAKIYRQMVKWCLDGLGTNKIAVRLNELGVPTNFMKKGIKKRNLHWQQQVVLRILKSPLYKGEFRYKGKIIKAPALISEKEWGRIQEQLKRNTIISIRNTKRFYLLRGLLYCSTCGRRFFGKIKESSGERLYCCLSKRPDPAPRSCGMRSINLDKANKAVWMTIREYILHSKKLREAIAAQKDTSFVDRIGLETELSTIRKRMSEADQEVKDLLRGRGRFKNVSDLQIDELAGEIKTEKERLLITEQGLFKKLTRLDSIESRGKEIEKFLATLAHRVDDLSDQEKSDVLHAIISRVSVSCDHVSKMHGLNVCLAIEEDVARGVPPPTMAAHPFIGMGQ